MQVVVTRVRVKIVKYGLLGHIQGVIQGKGYIFYEVYKGEGLLSYNINIGVG